MRKINIVDFRARPDRLVYCLKVGRNGYVIINNDPTMNEDGKLREVPKGLEGLFRDREIFVGKLYEDGLKNLARGAGALALGVEYNSILDKLSVGGCLIEPNDKNSYTSTSRAILCADRDDKEEVIISLHRILNYLEHFAVPNDVAKRIRNAYSNRHKIENFNKL